jgi:hypothetical protein
MTINGRPIQEPRFIAMLQSKHQMRKERTEMDLLFEECNDFFVCLLLNA